MSQLISRIENIVSITDRNEKYESLWHFPAENNDFSLLELNTRSKIFAKKIKKLGLKKEDRIGLILNTSSDYVAMLLAIWRLNLIAVPLRFNGTKYTALNKFIEYCDKVCDFNLLICEESVFNGIYNIFSNIPHKKIVSLKHFQERLFINDSLKHNESNDYKCINVNDIAVIQFSSGSTANPKGVIVTHQMIMVQLQNLLYNHIGSRHGFPIESVASWMPINHDLGLFSGVLVPIYMGCQNLLAPIAYYMFNPLRWFKLLSEYNVDLTFCTNSVLASTLDIICKLNKKDGVDLSNLHIYIAAEKVHPKIVRKCYEVLGKLKMKPENLHIGYGMAENTLGCVCTRTPRININAFKFTDKTRLQRADISDAGAFELVAIGTPDWRHKITIRDDSGNILDELTLGEINIESPCITKGYYNNPKASKETFVNGRYLSKDLGFYYSGEIYFYSRKDDIIILGGRNIVPDDVEMSIEELPFIRPNSTCLISVDDNNNGKVKVVLLVEINRGIDNKKLKELQAQILVQAFKSYELIINKIIFCSKGSIEKTSSGKKRRKIIRDRLINGQIEVIGI